MSLASYNIITTEHEKVVGQITRREKNVIKDNDESYLIMEVLNTIPEIRNIFDTKSRPALEETHQPFVVKLRDEVVSIYPVYIAPDEDCEEYYDWWLKFRINIHRNFIFVYKEKDGFGFELRRFGETIADGVISCADLDTTKPLIFSQTAPQAVLDALLPEVTDSKSLDFPINLPPDWEKLWKNKKKTKFVTFCE